MPVGNRLSAAGLTAVGIVTAAAATGVWSEPGPIKISGGAELSYSSRHAVDVPDHPGHQLVIGETKGANRNASPRAYFPDAPVTNVEMADLTQGDGPHQGYYTMARGGDTVIAKWSGRVTTTMSREGQPNTNFAGTWRYMYGTGQYAGIMGSGTYRGHFVAADRYAVTWQGSYTK